MHLKHHIDSNTAGSAGFLRRRAAGSATRAAGGGDRRLAACPLRWKADVPHRCDTSGRGVPSPPPVRQWPAVPSGAGAGEMTPGRATTAGRPSGAGGSGPPGAAPLLTALHPTVPSPVPAANWVKEQSQAVAGRAAGVEANQRPALGAAELGGRPGSVVPHRGTGACHGGDEGVRTVTGGHGWACHAALRSSPRIATRLETSRTRAVVCGGLYLPAPPAARWVSAGGL